MPAWAQLAAASLVVGVAAGISGLDVQYGKDGLSVRTGWNRPADSRQAAVLFDGLPLSIGWDHRSDPSVFPTTGLGPVVVVRGLSSLLQGPNALGGVVDEVTDYFSSFTWGPAPGPQAPPTGNATAAGTR